jgi:hypothetical protein
VLGHPNLVPTTGFAAPMSALIHLSERWSIFGISTLRYSRGPPTYSNPLNDTRTLNCSSRDGHRGSVDRTMEAHRTNGALSSTTRGVVTTSKPVRSPSLRAVSSNRSRRESLEIQASLLSSPKNQSMITFLLLL